MRVFILVALLCPFLMGVTLDDTLIVGGGDGGSNPGTATISQNGQPVVDPNFDTSTEIFFSNPVNNDIQATIQNGISGSKFADQTIPVDKPHYVAQHPPTDNNCYYTFNVASQQGAWRGCTPIQDEGGTIEYAEVLDMVGSGVTCAPPVAGVVTCTISGGATTIVADGTQTTLAEAAVTAQGLKSQGGAGIATIDEAGVIDAQGYTCSGSDPEDCVPFVGGCHDPADLTPPAGQFVLFFDCTNSNILSSKDDLGTVTAY